MPNEQIRRLQRLMERYKVPSKGRTICGHFSPSETIELIQLHESRGLSVSEIISTATLIGLPMVKKQIPIVRPSDRNRPRHMRRVSKITPALQKLMDKYEIPSKGATKSGHFAASEAVDVIDTAHTRNRSVGSIIKLAVQADLPELKVRFRPQKNAAA